MASKRKPRRRVKELDSESYPDPEFDLLPGFDPDRGMDNIVVRETRRSGPSTAARRALEALAESRRLKRELRELEDFEL